jgi:dihydroxyacetone kinase-like protein
MKAAMKMQSMVPSTMGTLMSSGLMRAGRAFKGRTELVPADLVTFVAAFAEGIQERGKCAPGDCTILDAVDAAARRAGELVESEPSAGFAEVISAAVEGAAEGVEATKSMVPRFGKAAVHAAKATDVADQGAVAGYYLLLGLKSYFVE